MCEHSSLCVCSLFYVVCSTLIVFIFQWGLAISRIIHSVNDLSVVWPKIRVFGMEGFQRPASNGLCQKHPRTSSAMFAEQTAEENANLPLVCIYVRGKGVNRSGQIAGRMGTAAGSCALQCCTHTLPWPVLTTTPQSQPQIFVATKSKFAAQFKNAGLQPRKCALLRDFAGLCKTRRQLCSWNITCGDKLVNCNCSGFFVLFFMTRAL